MFSFESEGFDLFWDKYPASCPRKVDKKKCKARWEIIFKAAKPEGREALFKAIMDGLERWISSSAWTSDGGKYIRAPLVWLNGDCWEDYPEASGTTPQTHEKPPRKPQKEDWCLCMERCVNCKQWACAKGRTTPPPMWPVPSIPEDCKDYSPIPPETTDVKKGTPTQEQLL